MQPAQESLHDVLAAYGTDLQPLHCSHCDWLFLAPAARTGTPCPHCGQAALASLAEESGELPTVRPPELVVPFAIAREAIAGTVAGFARQIPYPPEDLNAASLTGRLQPLFLPLWLVDISVRARWQAEAGFDYQVVSHRESLVNGQWQKREFEETRIRWEPRLGTLERRYDNVTAPALAEERQLFSRLGEFDLAPARPFAPQREEALFRLPNRSPRDAWSDAAPHVQQRAADECRRAAGADHIQEFTWEAHFGEQKWTHLLLPLYTTFYKDDAGQPQMLLIHGQTGRISGRRRASVEKARRRSLIFGGIALVVGLLGVMAGLATFLAPVLAAAAVPLLLVALFLGLAAFYPLVRVSQFNRDEARRDDATLRAEARAHEPR